MYCLKQILNFFHNRMSIKIELRGLDNNQINFKIASKNSIILSKNLNEKYLRNPGIFLLKFK